MNIRNQVLTFIKERDLIEHGNRILVACSGGSDSMALLHFLNEEKENLQIEVSAVHVNHMLRGEESEEDRRFVERFCSERLIPFYRRDIPIPKILAAEKGNLQAVCRRERYDYFKEVMNDGNFDVLALAHHADDQLETVLMGIVRGTSLNRPPGMRVIRPFDNGKLIRPFMAIDKSAVLSYLSEKGVMYREDSSNRKDTYTRNRFRHHVLPLLKQENPNTAQKSVKWTERLEEDECLLNELATNEFERVADRSEKGRITLDSKRFRQIPSALQRRIVLLLLNYLYDQTQIGDSLIEAVWNQCRLEEGNTELSLPDGGRLYRHYQHVIMDRRPVDRHAVETIEFPSDAWIVVGNGVALKWTAAHRLEEADVRADRLYFDVKPDELPLVVRTRREGDRIQLPNMPEPKKLSRVFIDAKVPSDQRDRMPLIVSGKDEVLAIPTFRYGNRFSSVCKGNDSYILFVANQFEQEL